MSQMKIWMFVLCFSTVSTLSAQTKFACESLGIGYTAPADFVVDSDEEAGCDAKNSDVEVSTFSNWFEGESSKEKKLAKKLPMVAVELSMDITARAKKMTTGGFVGYSAHAKATAESRHAIILILVDTKTNMDVVVMIYYKNGHRAAAQAIYDSIYDLTP